MKKISLLFMFVLLTGCGQSKDILNPDEVIENIRKCQSIGAKRISYYSIEMTNTSDSSDTFTYTKARFESSWGEIIYE